MVDVEMLRSNPDGIVSNHIGTISQIEQEKKG
jgi:hypothetical protein